MGKSAFAVHKALQKKQLAEARKDFKAEVMKRVEDELSAKAVLNVKAVFLLALKKEGWGAEEGDQTLGRGKGDRECSGRRRHHLGRCIRTGEGRV